MPTVAYPKEAAQFFQMDSNFAAHLLSEGIDAGREEGPGPGAENRKVDPVHQVRDVWDGASTREESHEKFAAGSDRNASGSAFGCNG
jgi:hypothetical protein